MFKDTPFVPKVGKDGGWLFGLFGLFCGHLCRLVRLCDDAPTRTNTANVSRFRDADLAALPIVWDASQEEYANRHDFSPLLFWIGSVENGGPQKMARCHPCSIPSEKIRVR